MDARVRRVIDQLESELHRTWTVVELAGTVELSVAQLTRLFRRETGRTPGAFLHELRMSRARLLLERTSMPIGDIMAHVGIGDRSSFGRGFRRAHGLSARTLRVHLRRPA